MKRGPASDRPMAEKSAAKGSKASVMPSSSRVWLSSARYAIVNWGMAVQTVSSLAPERTWASRPPSREAT